MAVALDGAQRFPNDPAAAYAWNQLGRAINSGQISGARSQSPEAVKAQWRNASARINQPTAPTGGGVTASQPQSAGDLVQRYLDQLQSIAPSQPLPNVPSPIQAPSPPGPGFIPSLPAAQIPPSLNFLSTQQLLDYANALARASVLPAQQAVRREQQFQQAEQDRNLASLQRAYASQQDDLERQRASGVATTQGFTEALSGAVAGVAPAVQQAYQGASQATANFSKGFSDGLNASLGQNNQQAQGILQTAGSPEGQQAAVSQAAGTGQAGAPGAPAGAPGGAAADVLYGSTGYIPAAALEREGAAAAAAAAQLPATFAGVGQQNIGAINSKAQDLLFQLTREQAGNEADVRSNYANILRELGQRSADITEQIPGIQLQNLQNLQQFELQKGDFLEGIRRTDIGASLDIAGLREQQRQFDFGANFDIAQFNSGQQQFQFGAQLDLANFGEQQRQFNTGVAFDLAGFDEDMRRFDLQFQQAETQAERDWIIQQRDLKLRQQAAQLASQQFTAGNRLDTRAQNLDEAQFKETQRQNRISEAWDEAQATGVYVSPTTGKRYPLPKTTTAAAGPVNTAASEAAGYLVRVDKDGVARPVLDSKGNRVPVPKSKTTVKTATQTAQDDFKSTTTSIAKNLASKYIRSGKQQISWVDAWLRVNSATQQQQSRVGRDWAAGQITQALYGAGFSPNVGGAATGTGLPPADPPDRP